MWVGRKVPERTGDKQHPILKVRNLQDNFALAWYANGAKSPLPLPWASDTVPVPTIPALAPSVSTAEIVSWQRQLANYRQNYLLMEERISSYVDFVDVPLQLLRNQQQTAARIAELEAKLRLA